MEIVSEKAINSWEYWESEITIIVPKCEWKEGLLQCVKVAEWKIATNEDFKYLCSFHRDMYKEKYC